MRVSTPWHGRSDDPSDNQSEQQATGGEPADATTEATTRAGSADTTTSETTPTPPNPFAAGGGPPAGGQPYMSPYPPPPPPYGQPVYPPLGGWQMNPPTSGLAIASLVCGIVGFFVAGMTSIPAVICGHLAWPATKSGQASGHGMVITGLILGYLQIVGWIVFWIVIAFAASSVRY